MKISTAAVTLLSILLLSIASHADQATARSVHALKPKNVILVIGDGMGRNN